MYYIDLMDINKEKNYQLIKCILVDEHDTYLGIKNIEECHRYPGILHRAFSIIIYNTENKILLQQRSKTKYTFPLHWTNSVCSHPRSEKHSMLYYVGKRIKEELGIEVDEKKIKYITKIKYKSRSDLNWCENEIDYIYVCKININENDINFNKNEINQIQFSSIDEIKQMIQNKILFSPWFRYLFNNLDLEYSNILNNNSKLEDIGDLSIYNNKRKYLINAPYYYINSNSGKKIRNLILDSICYYYNLENKEIEIIKTVINEIHNSSLLFDDIQDKSKYRRGAKCAHLLYGTALTINSALFQLMEAVYKIPEKIKNTVLESIITLIDGQGAEIYFTENRYVIDIENYMLIIKGKTSSLFTLPLKMATFFNKNKKYYDKHLELYNDIGIFFQKRDDYINIISQNYWKKKGFFQDFEEKKYGYPFVIYCQKWEKIYFKEEYSFKEKYKLYLTLHKSGILEIVYQQLSLEYKNLKEKGRDNPILSNKIFPLINIEKPILYSEKICFKYENQK
jgi:geranylgeranyl diphosphate synthase, type III